MRSLSYFKDLREYLDALERRDKLFKVKIPVVKETELMPMVRLQFRGLKEEDRRAFLFENVTDVNGRRYDARVGVALYAPSQELYALGMNCKPEEISKKWTEAELKPIEPKLVSSGPVQEVQYTGDELLEDGKGIDALPFPVELPGFSGQIRTTTQYVTKDPETGIRNCAIYSGHVLSRNELLFEVGEHQHSYIHWKKSFEKGEPLDAAIVIGALPCITFTSASKVAFGVDELAVAGGIAGEPIELVKCRTVDLEVPATAEIVIEGKVSIEYEQQVAPFGEYTGYMALDHPYNPILNITCVTHRKTPIFTMTFSQMPPGESSKVRTLALENNYFKFLRYDCGLRGVKEVAFLEMAQDKLIVICMKKLVPSHAWQALNAASAFAPQVGKIIIAVDEDIDPHDLESVVWALSWRMQPHRDVRITMGKIVGLDPSGAPPGTPLEQKYYPEYQGGSAMLIDATIKWPYPPVSLPRKEYMEKALKKWEEAKLPKLNLRQPWYGYELGDWKEDYRQYAELIVKGKAYELGDILKKKRRRIGKA